MMFKIRLLILSLFFVLSVVSPSFGVMTSLLPNPKAQFFDSTGSPLNGGKLYTCKPGTTCGPTTTTNLKSTYTDSTGSTANANPVVLDSAGRAGVWLNGYYKMSLYTSTGTLIWSVDNVSSAGSISNWGVDASQYASLYDAVTAIGSTQTTLIVYSSTPIGGNTTVPSTLALKVEKGGSITTTGYTLTINGPFDGVGQVFSGTGSVVWNSSSKLYSSYFGDTAAGIQAAISATNKPTKIYLPSGIVDLSTTGLTINASGTQHGIELVGHGTGFPGDTTHGTELRYSGTGYAIAIGNASASTRVVALRDFVINCNDAGANGIRFGYPDPGHIIYANVDNVVVKKAANNGAVIYGLEYSTFRQFQSSYNAGAGLFIPTTASVYLALVRFDTCSFSYNDSWGLLATLSGGNFNQTQFVNTDFQGNGYEAIKMTASGSRLIDNITFDSCWIEGNQTDAARTSGYYSILIDGSTPGTRYVGRINFKNMSMRGVENASTDGLATGNGQMYIVCSELTMQNTGWGSMGPTIIKPWAYMSTIVTNMDGEDLDAWTWYRTTRIEGNFAPLVMTYYGGRSTSGTGEDTLETITLPAKHFSDYQLLDTTNPTRQRYQQGGLFNNFHIVTQGKKTGAAGNKTIKLYWGSNVIATIPAANNANLWSIDANVTLYDYDSDDWHYFVTITDGTAVSMAQGRITQDTAAAITVKTTGECADGADSITNYKMIVGFGY